MLIIDKDNLNKAADIIKKGGIVGIPTETVYGIAANAMDEFAIKKIFIAKGRPQDNPLIVHICDVEDLYRVAGVVPKKAKMLVDEFWPGPLTIILPKSKLISEKVTAGLETVAIRLPQHKIAREIIKMSGVPLAAPSANLSGRPSPTCLSHVIDDMDGRIDAVVDGGTCEIGLESTVISFAGDIPVLMRPGAITPEKIKNVIGDLQISKSIHGVLGKNEKPCSPGMKYKHYSPKAQVIMVSGSSKDYIKFVNSKIEDGVYALCYDEDLPFINKNGISFGKSDDFYQQGRNIFKILRDVDEMNAKLIYARMPEEEGMGLAVYNRLARAAGFEKIDL